MPPLAAVEREPGINKNLKPGVAVRGVSGTKTVGAEPTIESLESADGTTLIRTCRQILLHLRLAQLQGRRLRHFHLLEDLHRLRCALTVLTGASAEWIVLQQLKNMTTHR